MLKQQIIKLVVGLALILTLLFGGRLLGVGMAAQAATAHPHLIACSGINMPPCN